MSETWSGILAAFNLHEAHKVSSLVLQTYCGNIFSSHSEAKPWKCVCADLQNHAAARAPGRFRIALRYKLRQKHANTTSYAQSLPRTCLPSLWCFGHRFTALSALGGFGGLIGILTLFMRAIFAEDMSPQLAQGPRPAEFAINAPFTETEFIKVPLRTSARTPVVLSMLSSGCKPSARCAAVQPYADVKFTSVAGCLGSTSQTK